MNEKQYYELCRLADQVLTAPEATPARISIHWLHIIREHPVFLSNYESLLFSDSNNFLTIRMLLKYIRIRLSLLKMLLKSLFVPDSSEWSNILDQLSDKDIIFVSHLLNENQFKKGADSYFGDLSQKLDEYSYQSLTSLLNHTQRLSSHFNVDRHAKEKIKTC